MPIYVYHCSKCGNDFEELQSLKDAPLTHHEGCGGALTKMPTCATPRFVGAGWGGWEQAGPGQPAVRKVQGG